MNTKTETRVEARKGKAARKADRPGKGRKGVTPKKGRKAASKRKGNGGGKALKDFGNEAKLRVLKPREITRTGVFKTGQTVSQNLAAQKAKGYRGRRKFIRTQIAAGRVSLR